jgi:hypothetical protein
MQCGLGEAGGGRCPFSLTHYTSDALGGYVSWFSLLGALLGF